MTNPRVGLMNTVFVEARPQPCGSERVRHFMDLSVETRARLPQAVATETEEVENVSSLSSIFYDLVYI